ncbi:MAG TPA: TlpA disulfide reductase family protein [Nitrospirota bacterium]|nr:TlpA disulfide reductase family protein [Nitrospirota bacterium]
MLHNKVPGISIISEMKVIAMRLQPFIAVTLLLFCVLPASAEADQVGAMAPPFSIPDLNGNIVTLQHLKGRVVVLDFWAPWCDQCREELPAFDALFNKYKNDGLVVIGVDIDSSKKLVAEFLQKTSVNFTVVMDLKGAMRRAYRFRTLPTAFIIGKDGIIRYVHMSFGKEQLPLFDKEIAELLKQP